MKLDEEAQPLSFTWTDRGFRWKSRDSRKTAARAFFGAATSLLLSPLLVIGVAFFEGPTVVAFIPFTLACALVMTGLWLRISHPAPCILEVEGPTVRCRGIYALTELNLSSAEVTHQVESGRLMITDGNKVIRLRPGKDTGWLLSALRQLQTLWKGRGECQIDAPDYIEIRRLRKVYMRSVDSD